MDIDLSDVFNRLFSELSIKSCNGRKAARSGEEYELKVFNVCKMLMFNNNKFCTINKVGGFSDGHDLICMNNATKIPIEVKKSKTPDWMQMSLMYINNCWQSKGSNKIPDIAVSIFNDILKGKTIFNNNIPKFVNEKITHKEWTKIKYPDFKDQYIPCKPDTIAKLYKSKGCYYIQVSGYGLYHTGEDPCNFNVPYFECNQQIRIRTKIHAKNKNGYLRASIMAACQPINISKLPKSNYTLDSLDKLPVGLTKIEN